MPLPTLSFFLKGIHSDHAVPSPLPNNAPDLHRLSLVLTIFAIGAAGDLTQPQFNEEAESYQHLASAALGLENVFEPGTLGATAPRLETVQAVSLLGGYYVVSGCKGSIESTWMWFGIAYSLATSVSSCTNEEDFYLTMYVVS